MTHKDKIIIGSDHAGFRLKGVIRKYIEELGYNTEDVGCYSTESFDYACIGHEVARKVSEGEGRGILLCGTGIGMSMVANRRTGVRAALCHDAYTAEMSRRHNNANILVIGSRVTGEGVALNIIDVWINTEFDGGRHQIRVDLIDNP